MAKQQVSKGSVVYVVYTPESEPYGLYSTLEKAQEVNKVLNQRYGGYRVAEIKVE